MSQTKSRDHLSEQFNSKRISKEYTVKHNVGAERVRGAGDTYIKQIADALMVDIKVQKTNFSISGAEDAVKNAVDIIRRLSTKAKKEDVTQEDVATLLAEHEQAQGRAKIKAKGRTAWAKTEAQSDYIKKIEDNIITFGIGPAGTGKTYLAVLAAAAALYSGQCSKIVLCRPNVEAGEKLGFLPGDLNAKMDPFMRPLYDTLNEIMDDAAIKAEMERGKIEIVPLAYMRGRTLKNAVIVLDEAQNTTVEQMKMFLTRIGADSKMIITGDITQIDLPKSAPSGLKTLLPVLEKRIEEGKAEGFGLQKFTQSDVVRHPIIETVVEMYEELENGPVIPLTAEHGKSPYTNGHVNGHLRPTVPAV